MKSITKKIIWFEHMYQPSWNFKAYGQWDPQRMINECYRPNAQLMKEQGVKINMNITQTMYDFFKENNALDVLELYKSLGAQIEYVGSTAHHILSTTQFEKVFAVEEREQRTFIKHYFGQEPQVFFPPEMAIDEHSESRVAAQGYKGMITSGGSPNFSSFETTGVFENKIKLFPHNNIVSGQFAFPVSGFSSDHDLQDVMSKVESYTLPVMFAFDHESFGGYHNPKVLEMKKRFFELAKEKGWEFVHFSELLDTQAYGTVQLHPTTWVGSYEKWDKMPDRSKAIQEVIEEMTPATSYFVRKWVLPSCHLHVDYATDQFWDFVHQIPA
jgi:hypothetical protein